MTWTKWEVGNEISEIICERVETQGERRRRKRIAKTIRKSKHRRGLKDDRM